VEEEERADEGRGMTTLLYLLRRRDSRRVLWARRNDRQRKREVRTLTREMHGALFSMPLSSPFLSQSVL
jgi:hypothetical protein